MNVISPPPLEKFHPIDPPASPELYGDVGYTLPSLFLNVDHPPNTVLSFEAIATDNASLIFMVPLRLRMAAVGLDGSPTLNVFVDVA
jgi:hypothetical protein